MLTDVLLPPGSVAWPLLHPTPDHESLQICPGPEEGLWRSVSDEVPPAPAPHAHSKVARARPATAPQDPRTNATVRATSPLEGDT